MTSRRDVAHSGRENLHHFLPVLLRGMLPLFSIITLWLYPTYKAGNVKMLKFPSFLYYVYRSRILEFLDQKAKTTNVKPLIILLSISEIIQLKFIRQLSPTCWASDMCSDGTKLSLPTFRLDTTPQSSNQLPVFTGSYILLTVICVLYIW